MKELVLFYFFQFVTVLINFKLIKIQIQILSYVGFAFQNNDLNSVMKFEPIILSVLGFTLDVKI